MKLYNERNESLKFQITKHLGYDSLKNQKTTGNIANIQENVYTQSERDRQRRSRVLCGKT